MKELLRESQLAAAKIYWHVEYNYMMIEYCMEDC